MIDKELVIQNILDSAGVIIDGNWIVYPTDNREEGYTDDDEEDDVDPYLPCISFFSNAEDQDPIVEFSLKDLDDAVVLEGELHVAGFKVQLLEKKCMGNGEELEYEFMTTKAITGENGGWNHALENMTLYICDDKKNVVCRVDGKDQLLKMCTALGLVGTGVRL